MWIKLEPSHSHKPYRREITWLRAHFLVCGQCCVLLLPGYFFTDLITWFHHRVIFIWIPTKSDLRWSHCIVWLWGGSIIHVACLGQELSGRTHPSLHLQLVWIQSFFLLANLSYYLLIARRRIVGCIPFSQGY